MKHVSALVNSILAGILIGIGGVVYLSLDNKIFGATFFSIGLLAICTFGLNLFTGKVCYIFNNKPSYVPWTLLVWAGNFIGTWLAAICFRATRISVIVEKAAALSAAKTGDSLLSLFILGIFCNILIFVSVDSYKNNPHAVGKYLILVLGVLVFILCGFEHCIADMFYFSLAGAWNAQTFLCIIVITLGNVVGGVLFPLGRLFQEKVTAK